MSEQSELWDSFYRSNSRPWRGGARLGPLPFPEGGRVLEVGCGNGKTAAALLSKGFDVHAVDFSEEAVRQCQAHCGGRAAAVCAPASDLPYGDGTFDGAVAFHVLEHLDAAERAAALSEVRRVLRPGAHLLVRAFSVRDMRARGGAAGGFEVRGNGIRYHYFTPGEVAGLLSGWRVASCSEAEEPTRFGGVRVRVEADAVRIRCDMILTGRAIRRP